MAPWLQWLALLSALGASYLIGSIPTGYWLVKWVRGVDIRTIGSGNVGATNAARAAGKEVAVAVFAFDLAKGLLAVRIIAPLLTPEPNPVLQLACGLAAVLGHNFSVFLGGRGGKGVATTIGVLAGTMADVAIAYVLVWLGLVLVFRYVSVGSVVAAAVIPLLQVFWRHDPLSQVYFGMVLAMLIAVRHRDNLRRLAQGKEHRVGSKSS